MGYQGKRTASGQEAAARKKKSGGKIAVTLLILALVCVIAALAWRLLRPSPALAADPNVKVGTNTLTAEERQAQLQAMVDEGMLTFMINSTPMYSLKNPEQGCNWLIENPKGNNNRFTVTISRNDTEEVVYQSGYLDPEQYIDTAPLTTVPPKGEYPCTAIFQTYRLEGEHEAIGQGGAALTLYIVD